MARRFRTSASDRDRRLRTLPARRVLAEGRPDRRRRKRYEWLLAIPLQAALAADIPNATDACVGGIAETTPSNDFVVVAEGVVRHEGTRLEWQRCSLGQRWNETSNLCEGRPATYTWHSADRLGKGSAEGWRLPTGDELLTIVERCHYSPAINPQVFPNTPPALYWSSSSDAGGLDRAWSVSFFSGGYYRASKTQNGRVRLVRGESTRR